jgi:Squalene-hopene cyclase C-terminal domain/Prenyltransferase and squalene oxidase repeat
VRAALLRTIPLLQRSDIGFLQKTGCVSCHHNSLTALTIAAARSAGVPVDDQVARTQRASIASYIDVWRERALQGLGIPGYSDTVSYVLIGMAAEKHPPDPATDALARYIKSRQSLDGHWRPVAHRPPLESSAIQVTAASLRALQVYAPRARRSEYETAIERAKEWLKQARAATTEDRAFQLLGLRWAGEDQEILRRRAASDLLTEQRADGGWGELPSLASDAYATGQALVALKEAGALAATDPAYRRGVEFLLSTQLEDGSWYVRSRSIPFQPYFESGFPHGHDQWISAAATNWAAMALVTAAGP